MISKVGSKVVLSLEGNSHDEYVSGSVTGLGAGFEVDHEELLRFLERRKAKGNITSERKEDDEPVFTSGLTDGKVTDGNAVTVRIYNKNVIRSDYDGLKNTPRPSHADYTAPIRYGKEIDMSGGGHFSGRLTAPLCALGGIMKQMLSKRGIEIGTHLYSVGNIYDLPFPETEVSVSDLKKAENGNFPTLSEEAGEMMKKEIMAAKNKGDSVGGIVECAVTGLPAGIGDPLFSGVENRIAGAIFGLGGVRGIEFGCGFKAASMHGSEHNDPFCIKDGKVVTKTNKSGGVQAGITNGMPLIFRVAFKPTASIGLPQKTVRLDTMTETEIEIKGRHDPCIAVRALPCVEAITAQVICDLIETSK